jgi:hypothetical protein
MPSFSTAHIRCDPCNFPFKTAANSIYQRVWLASHNIYMYNIYIYIYVYRCVTAAAFLCHWVIHVLCYLDHERLFMGCGSRDPDPVQLPG